jgi:hypothetical protein
MDLTHLMDLVNAKVNDDARRSGVMTLGALRDALHQLPPDTPVVIDSGGSPGPVSSYRGYYERLAFEPTDTPVTAAEVVATLNAADGETFQGYKGGDCDMDVYTFLHVASYGDCGPRVVGLRAEADRVVIETKNEEW